MSNRTEHVHFIHRFDEEELAELNGHLSDTLTEYNETEEEKKNVASRFNSQLKDLRQAMNETNRKIRDGYEERAGECSVTRNVRTQEVLYHLLETGELVKRRPFEGKDYQLAIDDGLYDEGDELPPGFDDDDPDDPQPTA